MEFELFLAYDGSINADWVAQYAMRLSRNTQGRRLALLHILDGSVAQDLVESKIKRLLLESERQGIDLEIAYLPLGKSVLNTLLDAIPRGDRYYCICGARATSRGKGFITGTISQDLLRAKKFNTLALRVVNPGLLGCPVNVLFPLSGHPQRFKAAMPFLQMLEPCLRRLILLRVMTFRPFLFRFLSPAKARETLQRGRAYVKEVTAEIEYLTAQHPLMIDDHVLISDDWAKEILVQASKVRAGLIMLGASDRLLQSRFYYGSKIEQILRQTPCDVGIYRKV